MFGFSPYMLVHLTGGPYLALVALLPVIIRLIVRRLRGTLGPRRFVIFSALCLLGRVLDLQRGAGHRDDLRRGRLPDGLAAADRAPRARCVQTALLLGAAYVITW